MPMREVDRKALVADLKGNADDALGDTVKRAMLDAATEIEGLAARVDELDEEAATFDERTDEIERDARNASDQRAHEAHLATQAANARTRRAEDDARHQTFLADDAQRAQDRRSGPPLLR